MAKLPDEPAFEPPSATFEGPDASSAVGAQDDAPAMHTLEIAKADSQYLLQTKELRDALAGEADPDGLRDKYEPLFRQAYDNSAAQISDPQQRESWTQNRLPDFDGHLSAASDRAFGLTREREIAGAGAQLDAMRDLALQTADAAKRSEFIQTANGLISGLQAAGYIDEMAAQDRQKVWAQDFALAALSRLPPAERAERIRAKLADDGKRDVLVDIMPRDELPRLLQKAEDDATMQREQASLARGEALETEIAAAAASQGELPPRVTIEHDPELNDATRKALYPQYDAAFERIASVRQALIKYKDPKRGFFDPSDAEDRANADAIYRQLGGTVPGLFSVVNRTGILPQSALNALRADLTSEDPSRVQDALVLATRLARKKDIVFAQNGGNEDIGDLAVAFRHFTDDAGAQAATQKIIELQRPDYREKLQDRLKAENIEEKLSKETKLEDVASAFNPKPMMREENPALGFDPLLQQDMFREYRNLVRERYQENGNIDLAKAQALNRLRTMWGTTQVNGTAVVMPYPPERAPVFAQFENAPARIAEDAIAHIKAQTGQDIDRRSLRFVPVPGLTEEAFRQGKSAPYILMWEDKDGKPHLSGLDDIYEPNIKEMREKQSAEREAKFRPAFAKAQPALDRDEERRLRMTADRNLSQAERDRKTTVLEEDRLLAAGFNNLSPADREKKLALLGQGRTIQERPSSSRSQATPAVSERPEIVEGGVPDWNTVIAAAFRRQNLVASYFSAEDRNIPIYREQGFDVWEKIRGTKYEPRFGSFTDIRNSVAFEARRRQIDREDEDRKILAATPAILRMAAEGVAGFVDLPLLLPAGGAISLVKGGVAVAGESAKELALHEIQATRTATESLENVGAEAATTTATEAMKPELKSMWQDLRGVRR